VRGLLSRLGIRGGAVVGLLLVVAVTVAVARLVGGADAGANYSPGQPPTITVDPTEGDDGEVLATPSAYPDDAAVRAAAGRFTAAWLRRELTAERWHAGLDGLVTTALAEKLVGVDPRSVPASRTLGPPALVLRTDLFAQVTIAVDSGTLRLSLVKPDDRWLVDAVDWERA
jgi:hypothetical protein